MKNSKIKEIPKKISINACASPSLRMSESYFYLGTNYALSLQQFPHDFYSDWVTFIHSQIMLTTDNNNSSNNSKHDNCCDCSDRAKWQQQNRNVELDIFFWPVQSVFVVQRFCQQRFLFTR